MLAHAALGCTCEAGRTRWLCAEHYERAIELSPQRSGRDPRVRVLFAGYRIARKKRCSCSNRCWPLEPRDSRPAGYATQVSSMPDAIRSMPALAQYREAIRLEPDRVVPYYRAAGTVRLADRRPSAISRCDCCGTQSSLDPNNPDIDSGACRRLLELGEKLELLSEAETVTAPAGREPGAAVLRRWHCGDGRTSGRRRSKTATSGILSDVAQTTCTPLACSRVCAERPEDYRTRCSRIAAVRAGDRGERRECTVLRDASSA